MVERIQIVVRRGEKERYRRAAALAGKTLSDWLRDAAREKLASEEQVELDTPEGLRAFFDACDKRESGREADWEEQRIGR